MIDNKTDRIQNAINHIKTATDIDPWAMEIAVEAMEKELKNSTDTISRQAAIDIERNATVDTNPSHFEAHQKFTQFMDDAEISSFGRWQWSNGFNTALTAVGIDLKKLPSVQPTYTEAQLQKIQDLEQAQFEKVFELGREDAKVEIIRCRDCRWRKDQSGSTAWLPCRALITPDDFYCGRAERRTDVKADKGASC